MKIEGRWLGVNVIMIADVFIVGMFLFYISPVILGDSPMARLLQIVITAAGGLGYFILCSAANASYNLSLFWGAIIFFGPIALFLLLLLLAYMYK